MPPRRNVGGREMVVMNRRGFALAAAGIPPVGLGAALAAGAAAQAPAAGDEDFTPPRTPWGAPDLRGIWSSG